MDARGRRYGVYYGKYVGELKDGYYHGHGTFTYDNGTIEEGIWENGIFQSAKKLLPTN